MVAALDGHAGGGCRDGISAQAGHFVEDSPSSQGLGPGQSLGLEQAWLFFPGASVKHLRRFRFFLRGPVGSPPGVCHRRVASHAPQGSMWPEQFSAHQTLCTTYAGATGLRRKSNPSRMLAAPPGFRAGFAPGHVPMHSGTWFGAIGENECLGTAASTVDTKWSLTTNSMTEKKTSNVGASWSTRSSHILQQEHHVLRRRWWRRRRDASSTGRLTRPSALGRSASQNTEYATSLPVSDFLIL